MAAAAAAAAAEAAGLISCAALPPRAALARNDKSHDIPSAPD